MMSRLNRAVQERGQAIILFVGFFTLIAVGGAIAVDFGIWWSERRGAQTDVDLLTLAGAYELLLPDGTADARARAAAHDYLELNDQTDNAEIVGDVRIGNDCFDVVSDGPNYVEADVRHQSRSFFAGMFGIGSPDIGATARACAGALIDTTGAVPIEIDLTSPCFDQDTGEPIFTQICALEYGSQGSDPESARGLLSLDFTGENCSRSQQGVQGTAEIIEWGAPGTCFVNTTGQCAGPPTHAWDDCAHVQNTNAQEVLDGFRNRISREGSCDDDNSGVEEFEETVVLIHDTGNPATSIYEPRICPNGEISPRIITIIVFRDPPSVNRANPIHTFAGFYAAGCTAGSEPVVDPDDIDKKCLGPGQGGPPGLVTVYGNFVKLIGPPGGIGQPNESTTIFGIALVK